MVVAYDYIMSYASNHFNKPIEKEAGYNASFLFVLEYANANCKCVLQTNCKQLKCNQCKLQMQAYKQIANNLQVQNANAYMQIKCNSKVQNTNARMQIVQVQIACV